MATRATTFKPIQVELECKVLYEPRVLMSFHPPLHLVRRWNDLAIGEVSSMALSPDGRYLVASGSSQVVLFDLRRPQSIRTVQLDPQVEVTSMVWRSSDELVVATSDGIVAVASMNSRSGQDQVCAN